MEPNHQASNTSLLMLKGCIATPIVIFMLPIVLCASCVALGGVATVFNSAFDSASRSISAKTPTPTLRAIDHVANARDHAKAGRHGLALEEARQAIAIDPGNREARAILASSEDKVLHAPATATAIVAAQAAAVEAARAARSAPAAPARSDPQAGPGPGWMSVSAADLGDSWPFTVSSGILRCEKVVAGSLTGLVVTFESGGKRYAVNGMARTRREGIEIDEIWAAEPRIPGAKKNVQPLIDRGLRLCS